MKDVADRAGVSPATVSRVLNGAATVRPEYRERVLAAIEELGYRPNRLASNLRRRKAETIGVVVSDIENPHFTQMVRAVEDAAYRRGYRVLLCNTDEEPEKQRSYLEVLADERVLGVILSPSDPRGAEISRLLDLGIPVVTFDRTVEDPRA
ncbi:MAG: LacI family DNA-binding transcriptional regulator, partial [Actinomycetota bacterium]